MNWFIRKEDKIRTEIDWVNLERLEELENIKTLSNDKPILIFKHSTRCSISAMAKAKLEREWDLTTDDVIIYYLDLIQFRAVSNEIASLFSVKHQSPQILLGKKGKVTYHESHNSIRLTELKDEL